MVTVAERTVANLKRDRRAGKRDRRLVCSLNVLVETDEDGSVELAETIGDREYNARRGRHPRSDAELAQLVSDVADVMASLADDDRELIERLGSEFKTEIARDLGISRTTLASRLRPMLDRLKQSGLKDYL